MTDVTTPDAVNQAIPASPASESTRGMRMGIKILTALAVPYALLIAVHVINPLLTINQHCPEPTVLEQDIGPFPPLIGHWVLYAVLIPFLIPLLIPVFLSVSGIWMGIVSIFRPETWPAARRRILLGLPFTIVMAGVLMLLGLAYIQDELPVLGLGVLVVPIVLLTIAGTIGACVWLFMIGTSERRAVDMATQVQGRNTLWAAVLGVVASLCMLIVTSGGRGGHVVVDLIRMSIPLLLLGSVVVFVWGLIQVVVTASGDDPQRKEKVANGKHKLMGGIITGIGIIVVWAVLSLLNDITGVSQSETFSGADLAYQVPSSPASFGGGSFKSPLGGVRSSETIGFSVGGAKDADNFRENIAQCFLPTPTDITYEGLFYDYTFDTRNQTECTSLFCPQYEGAIIADPYSKQDEYFLSVGLASNIKEENFARPPLDVVVVLDISGSMSSPFDRYYYDRGAAPAVFGGAGGDDWSTSKMEIAKEAIGAMADRLHTDDRFGLVVFDDRAETQLSVETMGRNGYARVKNAIALVQPRGGTNMEAGLEEGTALMTSVASGDERATTTDRERRIIFITDAMPNTGAVEDNELYRIGLENAENGIHTTFIGVGVDFNTELVEALTKRIRGANYYAIHSSSDFEKRLDTEFEYLVAPLMYDLSLTIEGGDYEIRTVYGSPEANIATGDILHVSTLFPSPTSEGSSRGGVILAHMAKRGDTGTPSRVVARYTDRAGVTHEEAADVTWAASSEDASPNVRKAVLLARYVNLMQNWIMDENMRLGRPEKTVYVPIAPMRYYERGLPIPREQYATYAQTGTVPYELGYWERLSRPLKVSEDYKKVFKDFIDYYEDEAQGLPEEEKMLQEVELLNDLIHSPNAEEVDE